MNLQHLLARFRKTETSDSVQESGRGSHGPRFEYRKIAELLIFALLAPVLGLVLFKQDPLGLNSGFPWAAVGPVIFAARYGSSWGFACALLAAVSFFFPYAAYAEQTAAIIALSVGTIVVGVVVGDSATAWRTRSGQAEAENQYLRHRLKEFSKDYHVLKVSHGQLEEFMAGQRLSLRRALQQLKPALSTNADGLETGSELMAIFAQFCSVQVAGLYSMKSEKLVDNRAIATHGNMEELPMFDPLLNLAIKERQLVSIKLDSMTTDKHDSGLLAVVPIVDSLNKMHGVLAIRDMHFMAFQQENLNILSLLGGYIGDMISRTKGMGNSRSAWFLAELDTALRFAKTNNVNSTLMCLNFRPFDNDEAVVDYISSSIRSLDASWIPTTQSGNKAVIILLPLMEKSQCEAYFNRIVTSLLEKFQIDMDKVLESRDILQIQKSDTRKSCLTFMQKSAGFGSLTDRAEVVSIDSGSLDANEQGSESVA